MNFHLTSYPPRGVWERGDVIRHNTISKFSDCVILGFSEEGYVKVARPYCYVGSTGLPLLWAETWDFPYRGLDQCTKVGTGNVVHP